MILRIMSGHPRTSSIIIIHNLGHFILQREGVRSILLIADDRYNGNHDYYIPEGWFDDETDLNRGIETVGGRGRVEVANGSRGLGSSSSAIALAIEQYNAVRARCALPKAVSSERLPKEISD